MTASSDTNRPGTPSGARTPDAGQVEPGKIEPGKVEPGKVEPGKAGAPASPTAAIVAGKPDPSKDSVKDAAKVEPSKSEPAKNEPARSEPVKADAPKPEAGKPEIAKTDPVKPETVKPDGLKAEPPKVDTPKIDLSKTGAPGSDAPKAEAPKPDPSKPDPSKTSGFAGGPQASVRPNQAVTDGPIIDLKAKRLPDPIPAAKASATGAGVTPGVSVKASETKPAETRGTDAKPSEAKPGETKPGETKTFGAGSEPAKPAGATTPRIAPATAAAPAARGAGFGSLATAGLLGGVIGAGLLFGIERAGILPPQEDARLAALDQRIAALAPREALTGLDKRVAANEAALKAVPEAVATAREALQKASAAPAAAPAADGSAPQPAPIPADLVARLDSLDQRVSALQEEPGQQGGEPRMAVAQAGAGAAQVSALDERLKALEGKSESAPKAAAAPDLAPKLAALQSDVEARTKANAQAAEAVGQKLTSLQQSLEAQVKAATEAVQAATSASQQAVDANKTQAAEAAKAVERQLQAQSDKIAGLDKAVAERAETASVQAALRVVSADRITTALNTGTPYADALASLRGLEPGDPARLTAVAVFADKGAPTARSLGAEFRPIADRIAAARRAAQTRSVAESGDLSQKLMSIAGSIVQVRKVDTPAASGTATASPDPLPAIQEALDRGDIPAAAQAFAALPEDVRAQAGEFGTKLKSRAAAGAAAQGLLADAFKAIPASGTSR